MPQVVIETSLTTRFRFSEMTSSLDLTISIIFRFVASDCDLDFVRSAGIFFDKRFVERVDIHRADFVLLDLLPVEGVGAERTAS
mmetsp:Transcript_4232/g.5210  ORF Transcript_4232/g.5210 Transcript_4232/m.5210 type:complete len:84 (+) Transcript_4232:287-538(+)